MIAPRLTAMSTAVENDSTSTMITTWLTGPKVNTP
jgi:hypothetical protein